MAEYSDAEIERMARSGYAAVMPEEDGDNWMDSDSYSRSYFIRRVSEVLGGDANKTMSFDRAVLAERARLDAERTPAPTNAEIVEALMVGGGIYAPRLYAFLSALPDEARRVGMAAMKGVTNG